MRTRLNSTPLDGSDPSALTKTGIAGIVDELVETLELALEYEQNLTLRGQ